MKIETVVMQEDGNFIVNGCTTVPDRMENRHRVMIQEWLDAGNTPDPYVGPTALENWVESMHISDSTLLPRWGEDILDGMDKSSVPQSTLDRLQAKKDLRGTKP
jgi:hypothetical protein